MSTESRLADLELRFMTLERFTQELSDVVAEQGRTIEALTTQAKRLDERLLAQGGEQPDRPPHY